MSGFDNFNTDFYQSSYSVDDQNQGGYNQNQGGYNQNQGGYNQNQGGYAYSPAENPYNK